ncbi:peptidase family M1, partial [Oesophagostomum dentatum]
LNLINLGYDETKQQFSIILDKSLGVGSVVVISIAYAGIINHYADAGLFYTYYYDNNNQPVFMVATKLESMHARKVFPCMDEPEYKAKFYIELTYPTAHVALSNMMETTPTDFGNGWSRIIFPPTQAMSTYLMVFTVGPYVMHSVVNKHGTLVTSCWTGQEDYLKFSAETAAECLYHMGEVTKIKFAMDKCDHLGLPEFPSNAMENYGLVIYRHHLIAINFKTATSYDLFEAARVLCHEVSHMWFGNLVTAKWWDNLFVNEGFATYLQQFIPAKNSLAITGDLEPALQFDASEKTHPLIAKDGPYFDRITYKKGGSLLRMLNDILGEEVMWDGLSRYLTDHSEGTGTHEDIWRYLTEAARRANITGYRGPLNISELMQPYALESGFPLVHARLDEEWIVSLSQEPFKSAKTQWIIPIRTASHFSKEPSQLKIEWLEPERKDGAGNRRTLAAKAPRRWLIASYAMMYGRMEYDDQTFKSLLRKIRTENVPLGVKVMLIGDEVALIE